VVDRSNENITKHFKPIIAHIKQSMSTGETCLIYGSTNLDVCSVFAAAYLI
jgi:hypothetical protein